MLAAELQRIASHLVSFGTYGLDMGAFTPFLYAFREREYVLDLFEQLCGARLTLSYINVGGVTWDLPPNFLDKVTEFLDYFEPKIDEYDRLLSGNHIFVKRTANVGVVTRELAVGYALSGPMIRGSGIPMDLRRDRPYSVYDQLDFDVCVGTGQRGTLGDCWDRYWVKMLELRQCVRLCRQCVERMPDGPFRAKLPRALKVPAGEVYVEAEKPPRPPRLLHRVPGRRDPVPGEDPRPQLRQPGRARPPVPRGAAGRRAGRDRVDRHCHGRGGSVAARRSGQVGDERRVLRRGQPATERGERRRRVERDQRRRVQPQAGEPRAADHPLGRRHQVEPAVGCEGEVVEPPVQASAR